MRHQGVDDVHGPAELDYVVGQLGGDEDAHHGQEDLEGPPLPPLRHVRDVLEGPRHLGIAEEHDQERQQEAQHHLQDLQGGLGRAGHAGGVDGDAGLPYHAVLDGGKDHVGQAQDEGHRPDQEAHQHAVLPPDGPGHGPVGHGQVAVHADAGQEQHAAAEVHDVEGGGQLHMDTPSSQPPTASPPRTGASAAAAGRPQPGSGCRRPSWSSGACSRCRRPPPASFPPGPPPAPGRR